MAKGAVAKEIVFKKILETFEGSFMYNGGKECRIPIDENGALVQIKVTLTCSKDNVDPNGASVAPAAVAKEEGPTRNFPAPKERVEPTAEERANVESLLKALGLD